MNEELLNQIDEQKLDELISLLSPCLEDYDSVVISKEGDEVVIYGENIISRTRVL